VRQWLSDDREFATLHDNAAVELKHADAVLRQPHFIHEARYISSQSYSSSLASSSRTFARAQLHSHIEGRSRIFWNESCERGEKLRHVFAQRPRQRRYRSSNASSGWQQTCGPVLGFERYAGAYSSQPGRYAKFVRRRNKKVGLRRWIATGGNSDRVPAPRCRSHASPSSKLNRLPCHRGTLPGSGAALWSMQYDGAPDDRGEGPGLAVDTGIRSALRK
jgi:hypothetical protein